ncbi:M23 family metallopeptidase [Reinekea sp.]|uniref:M23 family metallopeptidase n=1 Tax=Reinekea sp. TaxID=1970455 RepID=UPI00257A136E|nr:M23 family metallopeptidase [Reinekea sp.]
MNQSAAKLMVVIEQAAVSGGYLIVQTDPGNSVQFQDRLYQTDSDGYLAIGIGRELAGQHELAVTDDIGQTESLDLWIDSRSFNIQRVSGLPKELVTPPKSFTDRIVREAQAVKRARAAGNELLFWREEQFIWPAQGRISGVYGSQRYYNDIPGSPHWGVDIASPTGSPVSAPAGGIVVLAEADLYFSGGTLVLDHGGGLSSSFLHLSKLLVEVGQVVAQGQMLAEIGASGRATGPHLDWRMNLHGERIDAVLWVDTPFPEGQLLR